MLKDYLSSFAPQLHGHVELRAQVSTSHAVAMLNGDLQSNARAQQAVFPPGCTAMAFMALPAPWNTMRRVCAAC